MPIGVPHSEEVRQTVLALIEDSVAVADEAIEYLIRRIRIEHEQHWLGPTIKAQLLSGTDLLDAAGRPLALTWHRSSGPPIVIRTKQEGLTVDDVRSLAGVAETAPAISQVLLADAFFHAFEAWPRDRRVATLLAAIACEVEVKSTLTRLAAPDQAALVRIIIDRPRDVSTTAVSLLDVVLNAVAGVSLRDQNKVLYKRIDVLFQHRNAIAHKAHSADLDAMNTREDLGAARDLLKFLSAIDTPAAAE